MGFCQSNGLAIHYLRSGGGSGSGSDAGKRPLVMLHGLMGSGACWLPVARALDGRMDVILPDARGHGGSSKPERGYGYDDLADDVIGLLDGAGLARPVLLGHSMGGMTAAVVASRSAGTGRLRALVLVDPTFLSPERQREVYASDVAEQHRQALAMTKEELVAAARRRSPHRSLELLEHQAEARLQTSLAAFEVLAPPNPDHRELMRAIDVPVLFVVGDASPVVSVAMARELQQLNPRVRLEVIDDAGHGVPFDQPEQLSEVVAAFLNDLP